MESLTDILSSIQDEEEIPSFKKFRIRTGRKIRLVHSPNRTMRMLHRDVIHRIAKIPTSYESALGGMSGSSGVRNALAHGNNRYFYKFDLRSAFSSLPIERLAHILASKDPSLGAREEVSRFLRTYCSFDGGLVLGAPSSVALFNFYCAETIDGRIRELVNRPGQTYTRFIDDLVVSSPTPLPDAFRRRLRQAVVDAGFSVNHDRGKSVLVDRWREGVLITGAVITKHGQLQPSNDFLHKVDLEIDRRIIIERTWLAGIHGYLNCFDPSRTSQKVRSLQYAVRKDLQPRKKIRMEQVLPETLTRTTLNKVRVAAPLSMVVGRHILLKPTRGGRERIGLCPFHNEKTPSFTLNDDKGFFHCFGCGAHGDAIGFAMRINNLDFHEAVQYLVGEFGIEI